MSEETNIFLNPSVAAFIGAGSAFLLVIINDWRRRRQKKNAITYLVQDQLDTARSKLESIKSMIEIMNKNIFCASPIMPFEAAQLRLLQNEVIDLLNANENQGLNALLYWMNAVDLLLNRVQSKSETLEELSRTEAPDSEKLMLAKWILDDLNDSEKNMEHLIRLLGYYAKGEPYKILEYQHEIPLPKQ